MKKRTRFLARRLTAGLLAVFLAFTNFDLPALAEGTTEYVNDVSAGENIYNGEVSDSDDVIARDISTGEETPDPVKPEDNGEDVIDDTQADEEESIPEKYMLTYRDIPKDHDAPAYIPDSDSLENEYNAESIPSSYNKSLDTLKKQYPSTRDQNPWGSCWAHAAIATAEISMIKQGKAKTSANWSELALAYFFYNTVEDPMGGTHGDYTKLDLCEEDIDEEKSFGNGPYDINYLSRGGNNSLTWRALATWMGVTDEKGSTVYPSNTKNTLPANPDTKYAYDDVAILTDVRIYNPKTNRDDIKRAIMESGAVAASFYWSDYYYSKSNNSYYDNVSLSNHAISIVGWDDSFSRKNFYPKTPAGDGAWLIRNSWSTTSEMSGNSYFWMSYYDRSLNNNDMYQQIFVPAGTYDNNYQYDGGTVSYATGKLKTANIFTVKGQAGSDEEQLDAVAFAVTEYANVPYTIKVYTDVKSGQPESGTVAATVSGETTFAGYYTVELDDPVLLKKGSKFSVVVETANSTYIDAEYSSDWGWVKTHAASSKGESFVYNDYNNKWSDAKDYFSSNYGNVCIKAFTTDCTVIPEGCYRVRFNGNGSTGGYVSAMDVPVGTATKLPANGFVRKGFIFKGWGTSETDPDTIYQPGETIDFGITEGTIINLYAQWNDIGYNVTFDGNTATGGSIPKMENLRTADGKVKLPGNRFTKPGYAFLGWCFDATGEDKIYAPGTEIEFDVDPDHIEFTLYAIWKVNTYTVTFDANGGTASEKSRKVTYGTPYYYLPEASRNGYTFWGWYDAKVGGNPIIDFDIAMITEDTTLYAHWYTRAVTVTLDPGEGTLSDNSIIVYGGNAYGYREDSLGKVVFADLPKPLPPKTGDDLQFMGWYTAAGTLVTADDIVKDTADHTLYAKYSPVYQVAGVKTDIPDGAVSVGVGSRISLSTATPGAMIYYTLDGSNPTTDSIRYTDAIVVSEDMADAEHKLVIKAFAVKDSYKDSEITAYTIGVIAESKDWGDAEDDAKASGYTSPADIPTGLWTYGIPTETFYTGGNITWDLRVYSHKTLLTNGVDYTVKYKNNKNPGTATVTITGKGDYSGSITRSFTIKAYTVDLDKTDLSKATVTIDKPVYDGSEINLKDYISVSLSGSELAFGEDYDVMTTKMVRDSGKYDLLIVGTGDYTGTKTAKMTVDQVTLTIDNFQFGMDGAKAAYSKAGARPKFRVTLGDEYIVEGRGYTVSFKNDKKVATASDKKAPTLTIKGIGNFKGSFSVKFDIEPRSLSEAALEIAPVYYSEKPDAYKAAVTVTDDEENKLGSKDYTLEYSYTDDVPKVGTIVMVTVQGTGNYTDSKVDTYEILPTYDLNDAVVIIDEEYQFSKDGVTPKPVVKKSSKTLEEGKDYTLSYTNNKKLGRATVKVTGKGQYTGSVESSFSIVRKDISGLYITAPDVIFSKKAGKYKSTPVVKDENGNKLKSGTDYDSIKYYYAEDTVLPNMELRCKDEEVQSGDIPGAGTLIRVAVNGKGNYEGTLTTVSSEVSNPYTYRIALKSLSKAKVTIPNQIYTGNIVVPGKDQIVVKVGKNTLLPDDYEITGYANNVKNGTAKVTIAGKGNYTGTKTATFKIVKKSMFYTVVYNGNGSNSGSIKNQTIASGKSIKLSNFAYKKNYHITDNTVACWNTKADGSGTPYPANVSITNDGNDGETLVLYAQWKKIAAPDYVDVSRPSKVKEASSQQIVTWGKVDGAVNYILYKSTSGTGRDTNGGTTRETTYTGKKRAAGKKYFYKVAVVVKDKVGGKSVNVTGDLSDVAGFGKSYDKPNIKGKLYFTVNSDYYDYDYDRSDATLSIENKGNEDFAFDLLADAQIDLTCKYVYTYWYYRLYKYIYTYNYSAALVFENGETVLEPGDADGSYWTFYHYYLQYNKSYWNSISATATFYCTYDGIYYKCKLTSGGKFTATAIRYAD